MKMCFNYYSRLVEILNLPVSGEWLQSVDTLLKTPLLSDAGLEAVDTLQDDIYLAQARSETMEAV